VQWWFSWYHSVECVTNMVADFETSCILSVIWQCVCQNFCALNFNGTAMAWLTPMIRTLASPTVLNWDCQLSVPLTQLDLYYGCRMIVVVSLETLAYWIWPTIMYWCVKINISFSWEWNHLLEGADFIFFICSSHLLELQPVQNMYFVTSVSSWFQLRSAQISGLLVYKCR